MPCLFMASFIVFFACLFDILRKNINIIFFWIHFGDSALNQTINDSMVNQEKWGV